MATFIYEVKPNDTVSSIAAKFGKNFKELVSVNRHLPTKVIWHTGKPYTVFADLRIGQQLIIPKGWVQSKGWQPNMGLGNPTMFRGQNPSPMPNLTHPGMHCPPGYRYDKKTNTCQRISATHPGVSGFGLGAGANEACDATTWCDSGLTCSDSINGGVCQPSGQNIYPQAMYRGQNPSPMPNLTHPGMHCPPGYRYDKKTNTCQRISATHPGVSGFGLGAGANEACDATTWCDSGLTCSDSINGGVCQPSGQNVNPSTGSDITNQINACVNSGGNWNGQSCDYPQPSAPPAATPSCFPDVTGCNQNSDCCNGYCNTNISVSGAAGQCQTKGVNPPAIGTCKPNYGDACSVDGDCCSSKCQNGGCCGQNGQPCAQNSDCCANNCSNGACVSTAPVVIANVQYPCVTPDIITQVQQNLATKYPFENTVGSWGVWGPADTAALTASGMTFQQAYSMNNPGAPICSGDPPADVYCPAGQNVDMTSGQCVAPPAPTQSCPTGQVYDNATKQCTTCAANYQVNAQSSACIPKPVNITPVSENPPGTQPSSNEFPWAWVIGGAVIVLGGGTIAYFAMKDKKKPSTSTATSSKPAETTVAPAMAEPRKYVRARR